MSNGPAPSQESKLYMCKCICMLGVSNLPLFPRLSQVFEYSMLVNHVNPHSELRGDIMYGKVGINGEIHNVFKDLNFKMNLLFS